MKKEKNVKFEMRGIEFLVKKKKSTLFPSCPQPLRYYPGNLALLLAVNVLQDICSNGDFTESSSEDQQGLWPISLQEDLRKIDAFVEINPVPDDQALTCLMPSCVIPSVVWGKQPIEMF